MRTKTDVWSVTLPGGNKADVNIDTLGKTPLATLRDIMRINISKTKGEFSAYANKDQCIKALSCLRSSELEQVMTDAGFDYATGKKLSKTAPKEDTASTDNSFNEELINETITTFGVLNPKVAAEMEKLVKIAKSKPAVQENPKAKPAKITYGKGTVTIAGKKYNTILDKGSEDPRLAQVPALDPDYEFKGFQAKMKAGGSSFSLNFDTVADLLISGDRTLIVGHASTGKTKIFTQLCHHLNWNMYRFNGGRDMTIQELMGTWTAKNGETIFQYASLPKAAREGAVWLCDEADHNPAEINSSLHSVMENSGKLFISATGETITPHENFRMVFTANTSGFGDRSGLHGAAKVQDAAFISRFGSVLHAYWMPPAVETNVLSKYVSSDKAALMVKMATSCRIAHEKGDLRYPIGHRHTLEWAKKSQQLGNGSIAFAITVLAKSPQCDRNKLAEIAQREIGDLKNLQKGSTP